MRSRFVRSPGACVLIGRCFLNIRKALNVVLLFGILCFLWQCAPVREEIRGGEDRIPVSFRYENGRAERVCIAGTFNQWSSGSDCMALEGKVWLLKLRLPPGRHAYLLVIDDRVWKPDPGNVLTEDNGFGDRNSVIVVQ
jgi:hypothetical protein